MMIELGSIWNALPKAENGDKKSLGEEHLESRPDLNECSRVGIDLFVDKKKIRGTKEQYLYTLSAIFKFLEVASYLLYIVLGKIASRRWGADLEPFGTCRLMMYE